MLTGRMCLLALSPFAVRQTPIHHSMCAEVTPPPMLDTEAAPSWEALQQLVLDTPTGGRLSHDGEQRARGQGPSHTAAEVRLFDAEDVSQVRLTLYRDASAWCPYCQKVWLLLEEKRVPYKVVTLPLNAYGYKPAWWTRRVDGGKLPAVEIDGELHLESLAIMETIDQAFSLDGAAGAWECATPSTRPGEPLRMVPPAGSEAAGRAEAMMTLEAELQRDWFSLVFYPSEGEALSAVRARLLATLRRADEALAATPGPWLLGGKAPALVDVHWVQPRSRGTNPNP